MKERVYLKDIDVGVSGEIKSSARVPDEIFASIYKMASEGVRYSIIASLHNLTSEQIKDILKPFSKEILIFRKIGGVNIMANDLYEILKEKQKLAAEMISEEKLQAASAVGLATIIAMLDKVIKAGEKQTEEAIIKTIDVTRYLKQEQSHIMDIVPICHDNGKQITDDTKDVK